MLLLALLRQKALCACASHHHTGCPPPPKKKKKKKKKRNSRYSLFSGLCSDEQLSFFTLLDRASFPHYNNTKFSNLVENFYFMSNFLWTVIFGICPISRVPRHD